MAWRLAALLFLAAAAATPTSAIKADDDVLQRPDALAETVFVLTNQERMRTGLPPFERDDNLDRAAVEHSTRMLRLNFFAHKDPGGATPQFRIHSFAREIIGTSGENIWSGSGYRQARDNDLALAMVKGWMNSPEHRDNILRREFTHLGVGVVLQDGEVRAAQEFAGVRAMLKAPLPESIAQGEVITVHVRSVTRRGTPSLFDLVLASTHDRVAGPFRVGWPTPLGVRRGLYQLRFYFPDGSDRWEISEGPILRVR